MSTTVDSAIIWTFDPSRVSDAPPARRCAAHSARLRIVGPGRRGHGPPEARRRRPPRRCASRSAIAETSFDPAFASDAASDAIIANVFESMLDYDYLARPVQARAADAGGDAGGRRRRRAPTCAGCARASCSRPIPRSRASARELVAADYAYSFKRHPRSGGQVALAVADRRQAGRRRRGAATPAQKTGRFDYDAPLAGLEVVDRHTLRIRLKAPDYRFPYVLAVPNTVRDGARGRRGVRATTSARIRSAPGRTCSASTSAARASCSRPIRPSATSTYAPAGPVPAASQPIAAALKGKRLPIARRVEISIIEEGQARWLAFLNRELDLLDSLAAERVRRAGARRRQAQARARGEGHRARTLLIGRTSTSTYFNMEDPVVGGYTPEKIALRRAIGMGYNVEESIRVLQKGRAVPAYSPIPPDIAGYDPRCATRRAALRPGRGARAARPLRLQGPRRRRLSRDARRQAAGARALVDAELGAAPGATSCGRRTWTRSGSGSSSRRTSSPSCARWRGWARSRCAATAGTPTIRTPRTSCSCSTARTPARRTTRASTCPSSTSSTRRRARCPIRPQRTALFTG